MSTCGNFNRSVSEFTEREQFNFEQQIMKVYNAIGAFQNHAPSIKFSS